MDKKYLLSGFTLLFLNIISFIFQWLVQDALEFRYLFFSIVILITLLASYLYNSYKTLTKRYLVGYVFIFLILVISLFMSLIYDGFNIYYIIMMIIIIMAVIFIVITSIDNK